MKIGMMEKETKKRRPKQKEKGCKLKKIGNENMRL